jgi:hypothetical protein
MPKFLFTGVYTPVAMKRIKESGFDPLTRNIERLCSNVGGKSDGFWLAAENVRRFYILADLPDLPAASAMALSVSDSPALTGTETHVVQLLSSEEINTAAAAQRTFPTPEGAE